MENIIALINSNKWNDALNILDNVFTPISEGNTLFHFAGMRGNIELINYLVKENYEGIMLPNNDGNTGCHLLAINAYDEILYTVCELLPKILKLRNNDNKLILHCVISRHDIFTKIFTLMTVLNMHKYIMLEYAKGRNILFDAIDNNYADIINDILTFSCNIDIPISYSPVAYAISTMHDEIALKMVISEKFNVNMRLKNRKTPFILAILKNNHDLVNTMIKHDADINYGGDENDYIPINIAMTRGYYQICDLLINTSNIRYNQTDKYMNISLHYAIIAFQTHSNIKNILEVVLLNSDVNAPNIKGVSPLDLLKQYDMKEYITLSKTINNTANKMSITSKIPYNIINPKNTNFGLFNADVIHSMIYMLHILKKYNNKQHFVAIPWQTPSYDNLVWENMINTNENAIPSNEQDESFRSLISAYSQDLFMFMPHVILWNNKNMRYVYKNTWMFLLRAILSGARFVIIKLTLFLYGYSTHANMLMYDTKLNTIIRFEPYGNWEYEEVYDLDRFIIGYFKKCLIKLNKIVPNKNITGKLRYVTPSSYLDNSKFQLMSMDHKHSQKKLGDPNGYCLAWCIWFIEAKLSNPDIENEMLMTQLTNHIINHSNENDTNPFLTYIRNYASQLDEEKNKILKLANISHDKMYGLSYDDDKMDLILSYAHKILQQYC
jgi:hypothetical protein